MGDDQVRRSDRVSLTMPIEVTGANILGEVFLSEGRTELVARHGARIVLNQTLAPDQEITVRVKETGKESVARVVGRIAGGPKEYSYGISLLDADGNLWGIEFPPREESACAVGRTVLECMVCHTRELTYLDGFELEVLDANETLSRQCKRCADSTMWKKSFEGAPPGKSPSEAAKEGDIRERRRERRRELRVTACVRSRDLGEELVKVRNVSRNGLCFESLRGYENDLEIEVALPYSPGGGNIFLPARIVRVERPSREAAPLYGVAYLNKPAR
jgi:PilZ domain